MYRVSINRLASAIPSDFRRNYFNSSLVFGKMVSFALNTFFETIDPTLENIPKIHFKYPLKFGLDPVK
jgi:hypothetical protein